MVRPLTTTSDSCLIRHYEEQTQARNTDLRELYANILTMNLEDSDDLYTSQVELERLIFDSDLIIKKLLVTTPSVSDSKGVSLPKLVVPTFDGRFTNRISFWEQYDIAIRHHTTLSDVEKLAYQNGSLKDGSAKGNIDGLSTSGDFYTEAIETLKVRYNWP